MTTKKAVNLSLPVAILPEFDALAEGLRDKQKWVVQTAALLLLLAESKPIQRFVMKQVMLADAGFDTIEDLIVRAKSGRLTESLQAADEIGELPAGESAGFTADVARQREQRIHEAKRGVKK